MHRKHIRATLAGVDVDISTGVFVDQQFLRFIGGKIETAWALAGISSSTDNAVVRWDGTSGHFIQNSAVIIDDVGNVTGVTTLNTRDVARWVDGPAAGGSTDNAIARWDGTTGRLIQNSVVAIDDTGNITGVTSINGLTWTGDYVRGPTPAVAVDDHIATWNGASGRLIQDSGLHIGDVVFNFDAEAITNNLPKFQNSTGRRLTDSGIPAANVVQATATSVDNRIVREDGTSGRLIQSSSVTLDDSGNFTSVATINGIDPYTWVQGPTSTGSNRAVALWDNSGIDGRLLMYSTVIIDASGNATGITTINGVAPGAWVQGPASSVTLRVAAFNGTTGKLIQQANFELKNVATVATGDGVTVGRIASFVGVQNNSGTLIQDSGVVFEDLVFKSGSYTIGNIPRFVNSGGPTFILADSGIAYQNIVSGPGSATDNAIARYDGTTGKLLQNSLLTISDTGDLAGVVQLNGINIANYMITSTGNSIGRVPVYNSGSSVTQSQVVISAGGVVSAVSTLNGVDPATWVVGPSSATDGRVAVYDGSTGKLLKDGTKVEADLVTGPSSTTDGLVAVFNGITGKIIKSGTRQEAALVAGPAVAADNAVARFDATTGKLIQTSALIVDDSGNITGAGTYNTINVAAHALRHCVGGADPILSGSPVLQDVVSCTGSAGLFAPRAIFARGTTSSGGNPINAFVFAPRAGSYIINFCIPYALSDTSGNVTITISWSSGSGSFTCICGAQMGRVTSSGGGGSFATSGTTPPPISASGGIVVYGFLTSVSAGATLTVVMGTTGVTYSYFEGYFTVHQVT